MKSKTYIICWDGSVQNCLNIHQQLSVTDIDYLVYNVSSVDVDDERWARAENVRYYGHFKNALKDFSESDADIFIFSAGDPIHSEWAAITKRVESLMSVDSDIYAMAPSITNDVFSGPGSFIAPSSIFRGLDLSTHTNGIYVAMARELALFMNDYMQWATETGNIKIPLMTSGWGLDTAYCSLAIYWNKKIYRDVSYTVIHPEGSSTLDAVANNEMMAVLDSFKEFCSLQGIDATKIQTIYDIVHQKVRRRGNYQVVFRDLYVNLDKELHV